MNTDQLITQFVSRNCNDPSERARLTRELLSIARDIAAEENEACAKAVEALGMRPQDDAPGVVKEAAMLIRRRRPRPKLSIVETRSHPAWARMGRYRG